MENKIRNYIEGLFARAPQTQKASELKEEMILNIIERYHDLLKGGMSEEDAYRTAVGGIGDVSELIAGLYQDPSAQPGPQPQSGAAYVPPTTAPQGKKHSTAATVAAIVCGAIVLIVLVSCIAGASILRSIFSKNGLLGSAVSSAMDLLGSSSITWNDGGTVSIGGEDAGFDNTYSADHRYAVAAEGIDTIKVEWVSGSVTVEPYEGSEIQFSEAAASPFQEDDALRYQLDGNTLVIRFCKSKIWKGIDWNGLNINSIIPPKDLTVQIPAALLEQGLTHLELDSVSNSVKLVDLSVNTVLSNTVSGDTILENTAIGSLTSDSVSGNVRVSKSAIGDVTVNSVSGDIELEGSFGSVNQDSVSGDVAITGTLGELDADTISGSVALCIPEKPGFSLEFDTVSGDFRQNGTNASGGNHSGSLVCGDGSAEYEVETVSGDLSVETK